MKIISTLTLCSLQIYPISTWLHQPSVHLVPSVGAHKGLFDRVCFMFKLLSLCLLQFKFALVILGRPQFINEESEFFMNLQEFRNHQNQGTGDVSFRL